MSKMKDSLCKGKASKGLKKDQLAKLKSIELKFPHKFEVLKRAESLKLLKDCLRVTLRAAGGHAKIEDIGQLYLKETGRNLKQDLVELGLGTKIAKGLRKLPNFCTVTDQVGQVQWISLVVVEVETSEHEEGDGQQVEQVEPGPGPGPGPEPESESATLGESSVEAM